MSWVIMALRKSELSAALMRKRDELLKISQKLMDLHKYGNNIADGLITPNEFSTLPNSFLQRQMNYRNSSVPYAYNRAMQRMELLKGGILPGGSGMITDPSKLTPQQMQIFFMDSFRTELENVSRYETKKIKVEEESLMQEKLKLETSVNAMEAELNNIRQSVDKEIKDNAIKLA